MNPVPPSQPRPNPVPDGVCRNPVPRPTPYIGTGWTGDVPQMNNHINPVPPLRTT